jgi:WD40 repeat protein
MAIYENGRITLWDTETGSPRRAWDSGGEAFAVFDPSGSICATAGGYDPTGRMKVVIQLVDAETGQVQKTIPTGAARAFRLAFQPDGRLQALLGDRSEPLRIETWDVVTGGMVSAVAVPFPAAARGSGPTAISADGRLAASGRFGYDEITLWDVATGRKRNDLRSPGSSHPTVAVLAFSRDAALLAAGNEDGTIEIWDLRMASVRQTLRGHSRGYRSISLQFSPDGTTLTSDGADARPRSAFGQLRDHLWGTVPSNYREVVVWGVATGRRLARAPGELMRYYSPDGRSLATVGPGDVVYLRSIPGK